MARLTDQCDQQTDFERWRVKKTMKCVLRNMVRGKENFERSKVREIGSKLYDPHDGNFVLNRRFV